MARHRRRSADFRAERHLDLPDRDRFAIGRGLRARAPVVRGGPALAIQSGSRRRLEREAAAFSLILGIAIATETSILIPFLAINLPTKTTDGCSVFVSVGLKSFRSIQYLYVVKILLVFLKSIFLEKKYFS